MARIAAFVLLAVAVLAVGVAVAAIGAGVGLGTAVLAVLFAFGGMALMFGAVSLVLRRLR